MNLQRERNEENNWCHDSQLEEEVISDEVSNRSIHHVSERQSHLYGNPSKRSIPWSNYFHHCTFVRSVN